MPSDYSSTSWYQSLLPQQQKLVDLSWQLYERELSVSSAFGDYSFVVFPMAKAYEGFLKQYFFDAGLIDEKTFLSKRSRIGRALNPDVREEQQDHYWIFDDLARECGQSIAREIWQTWLDCRNRVFHYFPGSTHDLSLVQAHRCLVQLSATMEAALACQRP